MRPIFLFLALAACATPADLRARAPDHTRPITAPPAEVAACIQAKWGEWSLPPMQTTRSLPNGGISVMILNGAMSPSLLVDIVRGEMRVYRAAFLGIYADVEPQALSCATPT